MLLTAVAARFLHLTGPQGMGGTAHIFLVALRDGLTFALWAWGFVTRHVRWRDDRYHVTRDGCAQPVMRI